MDARSYSEEELITHNLDNHLANDKEYIELSDRSIVIFNQLTNVESKKLLLEYEETLSKMQCIAIRTAYNIGKVKRDSK